MCVCVCVLDRKSHGGAPALTWQSPNHGRQRRSMKVKCEQTLSSPISRVRVSTVFNLRCELCLERLVETFYMRLYIFIFLDVVTDHRELFGYMMISEWRPDPKSNKRLVCFFIIYNQMNRFRDDVTGFRGMFCVILFIFVLFSPSPPNPTATWNTAICPGAPGPIDDFHLYLFTWSLTALKMLLFMTCFVQSKCLGEEVWWW